MFATRCTKLDGWTKFEGGLANLGDRGDYKFDGIDRLEIGLLGDSKRVEIEELDNIRGSKWDNRIREAWGIMLKGKQFTRN